MDIKAADVKKLRDMTQAGMMDCKNALIEAEGDYTRAVEIIREKGKLIASKRADRSATEGIVAAEVKGKKAYMLCLACETDFVSQTDGFKATTEEILNIAVSNDVADLEALLACKIADGRTVADLVVEKTAQTGEKCEIPFYVRVEAEYCSTYVHFNKKLGTVLGFNKEVPEGLAREVAMQATAMAPVSISPDDCDAELIEKERQIGREQARLEGKPEAMLDRIADGKIQKFLRDNTLLAQPSNSNPKVTVEEQIKSINPDATVVAYNRFSLND